VGPSECAASYGEKKVNHGQSDSEGNGGAWGGIAAKRAVRLGKLGLVAMNRR
jgi:hypothetical protein